MGTTISRGVGLILAGAVMALMTSFGSQARADTINFYLTQHECPNNGTCTAVNVPALISTASAVEVIVSLLSSTSATVELIAPSGNIDTPAYINVHDGGVVGNVTATVSIAGGVTRSDPGQAEDQFGNMNTWTGAVQAPTVTFTLTTHNSFTWSSAADVLMDSTGYSSFYGLNGWTGFEATTAAQYAGAYIPGQGNPGDTPLPAALPLFASGLGALGVLGWRRKRKTQAA